MALSRWRWTGPVATFVPLGARTSFPPPGRRIEIGTRTVIMRPPTPELGRRDRSYQLFENLIPRWRRAAIIWSKMVAAKPKKSSPTWNDVKGKVADFDRAGLVGVLQALYAASKDNRAFLHARLGLGADPIEPFKVTIKRWLWPDVLKDQSTSVSTAKKAIADYKAATGQSEGLAELMVFYCECAAGFNDPRSF
jgi:hypothetical protein